MFDIAFSEVMIIAVIALIVIGPERLPRVARTLGHLFGRMQRYVNEVKADIQREVELDELRKLKQTVEESARSIEASVTQEIDSARQELSAARDEVGSIEALAQERSSTGHADEKPGSAPAQVPSIDSRSIEPTDVSPSSDRPAGDDSTDPTRVAKP